jgi:hypothetical protein
MIKPESVFIKNLMENEVKEEPTESAKTKPPTKVFILQVGRTRYYNISVEAESKEQAQKAWDADGGGEEDAAECPFEYGANFQPDYEWADHESLEGVYDSDCPVEDAEVEYNEVRSALGLEILEEELLILHSVL